MKPFPVQQSALLVHAENSAPQEEAQLPPPPSEAPASATPASPARQVSPEQQSAPLPQLAPWNAHAVRGWQTPFWQEPPQHPGKLGPQLWPLARHWSEGAGPGGPQMPASAPGPPARLQASGGAQSARETQLPPSPLSGQPGPASGADDTQVSLARSQERPLQQFTSSQPWAREAHPPLPLEPLDPDEDPEELLLLDGQPARQTVVPWPLLLPPWLPLLPPTLELAVVLEDELLLVEEPLLELPVPVPDPLPASGAAVDPEQAARVSPRTARLSRG